ncbi:SRPBCC domain-containing protein [Actinomycetospora sp. TBRC 11914]|uniref:SRPBCC domain-containing protein n=1 Tax=Actinomycetospora sp. TBRC 11914 TaxID=2729387 RepID=UPI00145E4AF4|nr:SRPBCC domain-containing protein [Actinomycetospora sp. TBRC 11914]NMO91040.1 toxin [Actinomycetospora sp. TBRC 11914]
MTTGTYLEIDGRPALRFVRDYPHPPQRVWDAVTDPTELAAWFPARVAFPDAGAPAPGAAVRYSFEADGDGGTGRVVTHEPPRRFTVTWATDELRLVLDPLDDGGCRLTFTALLGERDTAARTAAGWEVCLEALDAALGGRPSIAPTGPTPAWRRHYEDYVGVGVPAGAPVPDA